jgi:hypothetical protein
MPLPDLTTRNAQRFYTPVTFGDAGFAITRFLFEYRERTEEKQHKKKKTKKDEALEPTIEITWTHATSGRSVTYRFRDVVPESLWPFDRHHHGPTNDQVSVEHVGQRQWDTPRVLRVCQPQSDEMHLTMFYAAAVELAEPDAAPGAG